MIDKCDRWLFFRRLLHTAQLCNQIGIELLSEAGADLLQFIQNQFTLTNRKTKTKSFNIRWRITFLTKQARKEVYY